MKNNIYRKLLNFLTNLEKHDIHYTLYHSTEYAIMVTVLIPGEIWEIEFADEPDGSDEGFQEVIVEKYISDGEVLWDEGLLDEAIKRWSD